mmetsp:Transcript_19830/g.55319  ORF Transcript_19830/g.55319 Transcript_19830/m.55319 type:complete len:89 (-) Transcript_19830:2291-2557(-)
MQPPVSLSGPMHKKRHGRSLVKMQMQLPASLLGQAFYQKCPCSCPASLAVHASECCCSNSSNGIYSNHASENYCSNSNNGTVPQPLHI